MAFIGTPLDTRNTFQSLQGKRFNGDGSETDFTLDVAPSSVLDIEVFVGNVRQDPNSAYTLSGTTLTFTGAPPSGTNNIYVVHQAKSVGTIDVPSAGVKADNLNSAVLTGQTDIGAGIADADLFLVDDGAGGTLRKTAASRIKTYAGFSATTITGATELTAEPATTDEFIISDAGTLKRLDAVHMMNRPAFHVYLNANQVIQNTTATKIAFDTESFDSGGVFASNKFTVPSAGAGTYVFNWIIKLGGIDDTESCQVFLYKGGSELDGQRTRTKITGGGASNEEVHVVGSYIDVAAATNYYELYVFHNEGGTPNLFAETTNFSGYRLIGA